MARVDERAAIVTGATRGLGASQARVLVREGARVLLTDTPQDEGRRVASTLGAQTRFVRHDVTSAVVSTAEREFGEAEILDNNAGMGFASPIDATTERTTAG